MGLKMRLLGVREVEGAQACRVGPLGKQRAIGRREDCFVNGMEGG